MIDLKDKVCIVTGASRGIGKAIALRLAREGSRVELVARSRAALAELARGQPTLTAHVCDVTVPAEVETTVATILASRGRVDVLVNNAGIGVFGPLESTSYEDFRRVLEVNAGGTFLFAKAVLPAMKMQAAGDIINMSSVVGSKGYPEQTAYGASKHAVLGFTKALAAEVHDQGVRVRSICPGGVDTDMAGQARPDLDRSSLIRPEDVAEAVVYLLTAPPTAVVDNLNLRRRGNAPWF